MTVLGIDIGTTSCKCVAFDDSFNVVSKSSMEYPLIHKKTKVEQNPDEWWKAILTTVRGVLKESEPITSIGISSQGITFVPVDKSGNKLSNALTWLDTRAEDECEQIKEQFTPDEIFKITGKRINSAYTLPKLMWLKSNAPDIYKNAYKFLTPHDYCIYKLCGSFVTEDSLAAGTMAYDISNKTWSLDILQSTGIDIVKLPEIVHSGTLAGTLLPGVAKQLGLSEDVMIYTGGQDQKCAAYGAGLTEDTITVSLGTSVAITALYNNPVFTEDLSLPCFPFIDGENWVLEGFGSTAGASIKWFRDNLAKGRSYKEIDALIEKSCKKYSDVMFFPYLGGTGSPEWYDTCGGGFTGVTLDTTDIDMAKSVLEGVAFTIKANIQKMEMQGRRYSSISVFGGGAYSDIWLKIIANITGKNVFVPSIRESACLGAALKSTNKTIPCKIEKSYQEDITMNNYYNNQYKKYKTIEKILFGR